MACTIFFSRAEFTPKTEPKGFYIIYGALGYCQALSGDTEVRDKSLPTVQQIKLPAEGS
jgi:hypothetical protein